MIVLIFISPTELTYCQDNSNDNYSSIKWARLIGDAAYDRIQAVAIDNQGNIFVAGEISKIIPDHKGHPFGDAYFAKLSTDGSVIFEKTMGGTAEEIFVSFLFDKKRGNIYFAGYSSSNDIDNTTYKDEFDFYVIKTDENGGCIWQNLYGGSFYDTCRSIIEMHNAGYLLAGTTLSLKKGKKTSKIFRDEDRDKIGLIIKIDEDGNKIWEKTFNDLTISKVIKYPGRDYILIGYSSNGILGKTNNGKEDIVVLRMDEKGEIVWCMEHGGDGADRALAGDITYDNCILIAGVSDSENMGEIRNHGNDDCYVAKIDGSGKIIWENLYGGPNSDLAQTIKVTIDNGCVIAGKSKRSEPEGTDVFVLKADSLGNVQWDGYYGGSGNAWAMDIAPTNDNCFIVVGRTDSETFYDKTGHGNLDGFVMKISPTNHITKKEILVAGKDGGKAGAKDGKPVQKYPDNPKDAALKYMELYIDGDAVGVVAMMSNASIIKIADTMRSSEHAWNSLGLPDEARKDDRKIAERYLEETMHEGKAIEPPKNLIKKSDLSIADVKIDGANAVVKIKAKNREEAIEIHLIKENDQWKINQ